jgi:ribosome biogenesis GTPase
MSAPGTVVPDVLAAYGWTEDLARSFGEIAGADALQPARVLTAARLSYRVVTASGETEAAVSGRFRHEARGLSDFPAVGDWVAIEDRGADAAVIRALLPRRSRFSRSAGVETVDEQVSAANVDAVFLVSALNQDFNLRRLERYLTMAWSSGALPVVVLNKADLATDVVGGVVAAQAVAGAAPVFAVSAATGAGLEQLAPYLQPGQTVALLGSSGVGKSTLVNALLGFERQATAAVREDDDRGRHTTTSRELILLPTGALLVDTPGMRSLELWDADDGLDEAFSDIEAIAAGCRFPDCRHESEPGCAVRAAIESGELPRARLESQRKLELELRALEKRRNPAANRAANRRFGRIAKEAATDAIAFKRGQLR